MTGPGTDLPRGIAVARFVAGTVALVVLSALATLVIWAVAYPVARGWSATAVTSGSMSPAISVGDVLVTGPVEADRLEPGAVIVFDNGTGQGLVSHRLVELSPSGEYLTRGDANEMLDSTPVRPDQLKGIGRLVVPLVGRPHAWAANGEYLQLVAAAVALFALCGAARWGFLDEFDPWSGPAEPAQREVAPPGVPARLAPALAGTLTLALLSIAIAQPKPVTATYADPAETASSSITAAGTFP